MKRKNFKVAIICAMMFSNAWFHSVEAYAYENNNAKVLATSLTVRSKPDLHSSVIGSLTYNTIVSTSQESYGWIKIKSGRMTGWVAGHYLRTLSEETSDKRSKVIASDTPSGKSNGSSLKKETVSQVTGSLGLKGKVIVIDPGHGGIDNGVIGKKYGSSEKIFNLKTSRYLEEKLRQAGAQTIMTRTDNDDNPKLAERVKVSESKRADAFISIHYNASPKPVSGTLTFFYSKSKDMPLARKIEAQLDRSLGLKSNGISYGDYHVLRENARPSALIELGFLSNSSDESIVRTSDYQSKAAEAIVEGLKEYFNE